VSDLGGGGWDVSGYVSTDGWYHAHLHISEYSRRIFGHARFERAHVILGGVDTEKFSPDDQTARTGDVLYVGRILPHKGINYLIEGLPPRMKLTIVGTAGDDRYLADLQRLAAGKQVAFRYNADDDTLVRFYREASCVVLPSVYRDMYGAETLVPELLGQALLEGMACETPVICTDVASMPEIVMDGVTGFVVPPNDPTALSEKLMWLGDHPGEAGKLGRAGRRRVLERFTWPRVVRRCLEVYRR
jgi:glycosyltransferase involved in cell wall biosynthesis